jgi:16S rRNA (guanine527-N7)-methyltransferase
MIGLFRQRLQQQAERVGLIIEPDRVEQLARYFELLERWNRSINLTALPLADVGPQAIDRLFIEPLRAVALVDFVPAAWFDLGSGGGSPAVPMRIGLGRGQLAMVESRARKAAFLREVVRELGFKDVEVIETRIEALKARPNGGRTADLVTLRAVKLDEAIEQAIADLTATGAKLLMFQGPDTSRAMPRGFLPARSFPFHEGNRVQPFVRLP